MVAATKRRWFQFGLRTMFVVVTAFAIWLGWELKFVRERRTTAEGIGQRGGGAYRTWRPTGAREYPYDDGRRIVNLAPVWRRWMGDESYEHIYLPAVATDAELQRVNRLFPEAEQVERLPRVTPQPPTGCWRPAH